MTIETTEGGAAVKTDPASAVSADDFDAAFNAAIAGLDPAAKAEVKPAEEVKPAAVEVKPATEVTAVEVKPAAVVDQRQLAEEAARRVAEETAARQAAEKTARETAEANEIKDPVLTEDQNKIIASFEKEWPDVAAAFKVQSAHQVAALEARFARALTAIVGKVYADIAPLATSINEVGVNSFREQILKAHPDYDVAYPQLEGWIAKQPAYLTEAYKRVYNEGNVQEVSDLVSRFKEANGTQPKPQGSPAPAATIPATPTKEQVAAKTRAGELAPVTGKRTAPNATVEDANDYDGAFAAALEANK